jgi:hypothetical protein
MMLIAGGMLAALALGYAANPARPHHAAMTAAASFGRAPPPAALSSEEILQCRNTIAAATRDGLIRDRPSPDAVRVDDELWHGLRAESQGRIMQALACDLWRVAAPPQDRKVVAYGWISGRRLAVLSGVRRPR